MSLDQDEVLLFIKSEDKLSNQEKLLQEQERLEKIVLGKKRGLFDAVGKSTSDNEVEEDQETDDKPQITDIQSKAAWVDEDDDQIEIPFKLKKYATSQSEDSYQNVLRRKFNQTVGTPKWATKKEPQKADSDDDDIDETRRCGKLLTKKSPTLPKGVIRVEKMEDLNKETKIEGPLINAVEFHPTSTVALVAGISGTASIFQVDGVNNNKLQTIKFKDFPINCARFSKDGEQFYVGSRSKRSFFYYDMMEGKSVQVPFHHSIGAVNMSNFQVSPDGKFIAICGKYGNIHLLAAKTKEWIGDLKMNNDAIDICFNNDGSTMYSYGDRGEIYEWDMKTRYCVKKMQDEGCLKGIKMTLSSNNQVLATGSSSGIVNLYEMPTKSNYIEPKKVVNNLVTPITSLQFNSSSEILAIASNEKKNAVRLVHFPSMTVFSNFPGFQSNISLARVMSFSPSSGFFAIGNDQRKVLLYRLKHYKNY
ncbi:U3 small nucleolar RNA-associated protein 18 homolog [Planococcus citri]|uniref:U3 small nucleolar RNA-associated protein 18 homolog n=1 Tax=Planococcus citri TaxID=170843 RepID=UPI0031F9CB70